MARATRTPDPEAARSLLNIEQLVEIYPDACIAQTHRDPVRTIVSTASLIRTVQSILKPDIDRKGTGRQALELFAAHLERVMHARRSVDIDGRVLDIAYSDTVTDPVGTVRRTFEHFGLSFSDEHADRIERHMVRNP